MRGKVIGRIFYAAGGAGNIIEAHEAWRDGRHLPSEVSVTFSSQIEQFCKDLGAEAWLVSPHPQAKLVCDGPFKLEHRPKKPRGGIGYHVGELLYGLRLVADAVRFRSHLVLVDTGAASLFAFSLLRLFGIPVIGILHNTLWASGFPPARPADRLVMRLDRFFWRWCVDAAIAVSPECERQLRSLAGSRTPPILQTRAQFLRDYFAAIPPTPAHSDRPFRIMFIGRVHREKGVLDIVEMARSIEDRHPGLVRWTICGRGPDFDAMVAKRDALELGEVVDIRGWTSLEDLQQVYANSHAAIVPTRSDFAEGLAMTAAEAVLAGRPVVSNPVVPALEILAPACVAGRTNDVPSHVEAVLELALDEATYLRCQRACAGLGEQFYDRSNGLTAILHRAVDQLGLRAEGGGQALR